MTNKDLNTGEVSIREDALRTDLETIAINAGDHAEDLAMKLVKARDAINSLTVPMVYFTNASENTLTSFAEADEILANILRRLSTDKCEQSAYERTHKI